MRQDTIDRSAPSFLRFNQSSLILMREEREELGGSFLESVTSNLCLNRYLRGCYLLFFLLPPFLGGNQDISKLDKQKQPLEMAYLKAEWGAEILLCIKMHRLCAEKWSVMARCRAGGLFLSWARTGCCLSFFCYTIMNCLLWKLCIKPVILWAAPSNLSAFHFHLDPWLICSCT